jgi:nitrite reductase/ring-hydroxylating ferredoxin subunit
MKRKIKRDVLPPSLPIVDALIESDQLVLLSPSFVRLSVPLEKLSRFIGTKKSEVVAFKIDADGRFLYWPHADVHLGWTQFRQIVDPASAVACSQKTQKFNQRYGAAIRSMRESHRLKQSDIHGITDRQLRRVEHGEQAVSSVTLEALAKAHSLSLDDYLNKLSKLVGLK